MPSYNASINSASGSRHAAVIPSNTVGFGQARALYVGTAGDVNVVDLDGVAAVYKNVASGSTLQIQCQRVNTTSTTATDIIALF